MANALRKDLLASDPEELSPDIQLFPRISQSERLAERAKNTNKSWKAIATQKAKQFQDSIHNNLERLEHRAYACSKDAKFAFNRLRQERPLVIVGAAAGLGLLVGVALRVWRNNRA